MHFSTKQVCSPGKPCCEAVLGARCCHWCDAYFSVLILCDLNACSERNGPLSWEIYFQDITISEMEVPFLLKLSMWFQIKCVERQKKSHLQHWQSSKALQKIGPFYSWYLSLINFIMHNQSFYFLTIFLKHFDKVNRKHGLLTLGDQRFDNGRASTANGVIACRVQLNMIDECNQPLQWLFKSNPFSFELQRIFQPGKARMKKFSAEHTGPMQPSHPALWVRHFYAF